MSRRRGIGEVLGWSALPWYVMALAILLASGMYVSEIADREDRARERLTLRAQRLALDLAHAAAQPAGLAAAETLLRERRAERQGTTAAMHLAVDDVTTGVRVPLHRDGPEAAEPLSDAGERWFTSVQQVAVGERVWELRVAQPLSDLAAADKQNRTVMIAGLMAIPLLSILFWRLQRRGLKLQARKSNDFLQAVIDALPAPVFVKDSEHRYLMLNKAFGAAFGVDTRALIGKTDLDTHDAVTVRRRFDEDEQALLANGIIVSTQNDLDPQGRQRYWLQGKAALALPEGGRGVCGILTDVTAQRQAEAHARATRDFMQAAIDSLPQPMYVKDEHSRWVLVNSAFSALMGRASEDLIGHSDADFWDAETARRYREHDRAALEGADSVAREEEVVLPDGRAVTLVTNKRGLVTPDGRRNVIGILFDVTSARVAARELEHARQFLDAIIDALPHSLVVKDEGGHYRIVNRAWCEAVAIDSAQVLGRTAREIFPAEIADRLDEQDAEAWATGGTVTVIQPRVSLRGETGWSLKSKRVVSLPNGKRYNVQVTTDVTAQQAALQEAQRSRELLSGVLDALPNPLIVKDAQLRYALVNAAACKLGSPGRLRTGASDQEVFAPEVCARYAAEDAAALGDLQTHWYSDYRVDQEGNERWWVKSKRAITVLGDEKLIVSVLSDVTALKVAERNLMRNQARLQVLHDLAMLMLEQPGLKALGAAACTILARRLEGRRVSYATVDEGGGLDVTCSIGSDPLPSRSPGVVTLASTLEQCLDLRHLDLIDVPEPGVQDAAYAIRRMPNSEPCWTLLIPMVFGERLAGVVIVEGEATRPWASHERQLLKDAADQLRVACRAQQSEMSRQAAEVALRESEAELRTHRDNLQLLVEERTRDLTRAMTLAEAANQSKSQFFNNMSHELRTPMNSVISFARLGLEKVRAGTLDPAIAQMYLERIERSAGRLLLLINDLLDLAKLEAGRMTYRFDVRDVRPLIETVCQELSAMALKESVTFRIDCRTERPFAWCDELRMEQVIRNVLSNALRYSPRESVIVVGIESGLLAPEEHENPQEVLHITDALEITVTDHGPGIPPGELDLIFDKYAQSSRLRGQGTGLGLPIAREIMRQHKGAIFASNAAHGGAVMTLVLPAAAPAPESPRTVPEPRTQDLVPARD